MDEKTKENSMEEERSFWENEIRNDAERAGIDCRGIVGMAILHTMAEKILELKEKP